jgi:hypothetical protein
MSIWLAVDKDGTEGIFEECPARDHDIWHDRGYFSITPPNGTIKRLIGRELRWEDNPEEVSEYCEHEYERGPSHPNTRDIVTKCRKCGHIA